MKHPAIRKIRKWLTARAENHRANLQLIVTGAGIFFLGAAIIIWADKALPSSIEQELIALAGMLLCVGGGITTLIGYLSLSVLRLLSFFDDEK